MTAFACFSNIVSEHNSALQRGAIAAAGFPKKYLHADEGVSDSPDPRPRLDSPVYRLDDGHKVGT